MENSMACYLCHKIYKPKCVLNRHLREVHKVKVLPAGSLKCPLCTCYLNRHTSLRIHLEDSHKIKCERRNMKFPTYEGFQRWKTREEKETLYSYTMKTSAKTVAGNAERFYFHCHRSGHYHSQSIGERKLKRQGSNRIESTCPSMMVVTKEGTGQTKVHYWQTHVGHEAELAHTVLSRKERAVLTGRPKRSRRKVDVQGVKVEIKDIPLREDVRAVYRRSKNISGRKSPDVVVQRIICELEDSFQEDAQQVRLRRKHNLQNIKLTVTKVTDHSHKRLNLPALDSSSIVSDSLLSAVQLHIVMDDKSEKSEEAIRLTAEVLLKKSRRARNVSQNARTKVLRLLNEAVSILGEYEES